MFLHPKQVAWLGRIGEVLPHMLHGVRPGEHQDLRLGDRRRADGVLVEVWLVVKASPPVGSPMCTHGVIVGDAANDDGPTDS
ncbi:MAG: hypothetical protein AAGA11_10925 [Pseudomonadota bacterium]